jgi:hypothetical protein
MRQRNPNFQEDCHCNEPITWVYYLINRLNHHMLTHFEEYLGYMGGRRPPIHAILPPIA